MYWWCTDGVQPAVLRTYINIGDYTPAKYLFWFLDIMGMDVNMYIYSYDNIYIYTCVYNIAYIYIYVSMYTTLYVYIYMYTTLYIYMYTPLYTYVYNIT